MSQPLRWVLILHRKTAPNPQVQAPILNRDIQPTQESPIFSPDLENGRGFLDFPLIVRDPPDEIPSSIIRPKPGTRPESRDSPIIRARQQVTSPDRGGLSDTTSRRKSVAVQAVVSGEYRQVGSRTKLHRDNRTILTGGISSTGRALCWSQRGRKHFFNVYADEPNDSRLSRPQTRLVDELFALDSRIRYVALLDRNSKLLESRMRSNVM